jgi:hypothetical protein
MVMERTLVGSSPGVSSPIPQHGIGTTPNFCVVPRCTIKVEKGQGGFKINCRCEDDMATATLQNLCKMLAGGVCSCHCTFNGIPVFQCNLVCGTCKVEYTKDGCSITCTSGDKACGELLQSFNETLTACIKNGCCCYVCFNHTPVCCGS